MPDTMLFTHDQHRFSATVCPVFEYYQSDQASERPPLRPYTTGFDRFADGPRKASDPENRVQQSASPDPLEHL